jgi:hypothetical protein
MMRIQQITTMMMNKASVHFCAALLVQSDLKFLKQYRNVCMYSFDSNYNCLAL